jgi:hypothetical protein
VTKCPKSKHPDWDWEYWDAQIEGFFGKAKNDCEECLEQ